MGIWRGWPALVALSTVAVNAAGQPQTQVAPSTSASVTATTAPPATEEGAVVRAGAESPSEAPSLASVQESRAAPANVSPPSTIAAPANGVHPPTSTPERRQSGLTPNPGSSPNTSSAASTASLHSGTTPTPPEQPETPLYALFDVGFIVQNLWNKDSAYDYFSDRDGLLMGGISLGVDALSVTPKTVLNVDLTAAHGETTDVGPLPQYIAESTLRRTDLGLGVGLRHHVFPWLAPHLRVAGAVSFANATVRGADFATLEHSDVGPAAFLGGGVTFFTPAKRLSSTRAVFNSLALRVSVEGGYQWTQTMSFEVPEQPASDEPSGRIIRRAATPLGDLAQNGAYLRVVASAHF